MRNTVARATIKVNGKPQTPVSIDIKFDLDDQVGSLTLRAKNSTNRLSRVGRAKECSIGLFFACHESLKFNLYLINLKTYERTFQD